MANTDRPPTPEQGAPAVPASTPGPSGLRLVRRSRALPIALLASVVGLVLCGVTYAVAGETVHTRDIDLIDPLPDGVVTVSNDVYCATVPGSEVEQCRRRVTVRREGTPTEVLADELASLYRDRGFELNAVIAGNGRTYFGAFGGPCGPQLFLGGSQLNGVDPTAQPGGLTDDTELDPTTTTPTSAATSSTEVTTTTDPSAVAPAADGSGEPIVSSPLEPGAPGEGTPTETVPTETSAVGAAGFQADPNETVPTETAPTETAPTETGPAATTTIPLVGQAEQIPPPSIVRQPPSQSASRGALPADVVTIEISEPYPGIC